MPTTKANTLPPAANSERALTVAGASPNEQDWCVVFNIAAIEEGIKTATSKEVNGVKMLDGRAEANPNIPATSPCQNSPQWLVTRLLDGKYIMLNGKLPPTVTVLMSANWTICSQAKSKNAT